MFISKIAAQAIVEEIGHEIREHINMMDSRGRIIASTDFSRIGQMHEGAVRIITEGLPELYITEEMETDTTRRGINLPLVVKGQIVGVVGITGEKERVMRYGNIVRRMTEIMVIDSMEKDVRRYDRRMRFRFIEEWISRSDTSYDRNFIERGKHLGIDILCPRRVMMLRFVRFEELSDTVDGQKLMDEMEASIRHVMEQKNVPYLRRPPEQVCLYPDCTNDFLEEEAAKLSDMIEKKYDWQLAVGIDGSFGDRHDIRLRCSEAEKALSQALMWGKKLVDYDELNIELILNEISESAMKEYLGKVFGRLPEGMLGDYMKLIETYFTYDGSISRMAEALYVHKNTLQYRLRKLAEYTGSDIRLPSNASVFHMALLFYRKLSRNRIGRGESIKRTLK